MFVVCRKDPDAAKESRERIRAPFMLFQGGSGIDLPLRGRISGRLPQVRLSTPGGCSSDDRRETTELNLSTSTGTGTERAWVADTERQRGLPNSSRHINARGVMYHFVRHAARWRTPEGSIGATNAMTKVGAEEEERGTGGSSWLMRSQSLPELARM